ncbi:MAG: hypothetical protein KF760_01555 [Candidatus Eremiobacteraeota bacterium]|nr:hypothetical protein [Candidatus Eremiobacteraeota bacterium]MCW5870930.1 hypothetical protein [Candidatus Eremiobacteraeota bacterium]
MKSTSKTMAVVALSLLVFPGSGHFVAGRPWRGVIWAGVFGAILVSIILIFGVNLGKVMDGMMSPTGEVPIDARQVVVLAGLGLGSFIVWGLAGLDAWWLARSLPKVSEEGVGMTPAPQAPAPPPPPEF